MSDPVTNVEIEDVLSSIRRLVSDGDKARTRDTAPAVADEELQNLGASTPVESPESHATPTPQDRLVLTPAFLVSDAGGETDEPEETAVAAQEDAQDSPQAASDEWDNWKSDLVEAEDASDDPQSFSEDEASHDAEQDQHGDVENIELPDGFDGSDTHEDADETDGPLELTNMVWDTPENDASNDDAQDETRDDHGDSAQTPDRSELVATIAELEAAISNDTDEYEPDGSEPHEGEHMAQTIAWPGTFSRKVDTAEVAETSETSSEGEAQNDAARVMTFQRSTTIAVDDSTQQDDAAPEFDDNATDDVEAFDETPLEGVVPQEEDKADVYADDDLEGLLTAGGVTLDDAALRELVADVVREELTGPMGERITRNVRKLVRREIYRVLSSQEFD